jgi:hypothetical protein
VSETLMVNFPLFGGVTTNELLMVNHLAYVNLQPKISTLLQQGFGLCDIQFIMVYMWVYNEEF